MFVEASVRVQIAGFLNALLQVYSGLILAWVLSSWIQVAGSIPTGLLPVIRFLDGTVGPPMKVARRFIPPLGPIDISPIIVLLVVQILGGVLVGLIHG
jgi:uncharacterized protein YggT (Ycf19 family)